MGINSERNVTNQSFKGKISEIISILSGETYTPTPAANDTEMLNCGTFEYYMDILKENISSGGGGSNDFLITGTFDENSGSPTIITETTISDILSAYDAGKNIKLKIYGGENGDVIGYLTYIIEEGDDPSASFLSFTGGLGVIECNKNGWQLS